MEDPDFVNEERGKTEGMKEGRTGPELEVAVDPVFEDEPVFEEEPLLLLEAAMKPMRATMRNRMLQKHL